MLSISDSDLHASEAAHENTAQSQQEPGEGAPLERRRQRRSHPKVHSTTQRRDMTTTPLASLGLPMTSTVIGQFASLSVLAGIVAAFIAARFDRRHASTVEAGRVRVRTTPRPGPRVEIGLNRRKRRTILRSCPPTAPCPEHAGDRVHHVAQIHLTGTTRPA